MNVRFLSRAARVALAAGIFATTLGGASAAHANLCNPQPKPTVSTSITKGVFYEHEKVIVWLNLSNASCSRVSVDLSMPSGTALAYSDYVGPNTTVVFQPGMTTVGYTIWGLEDDEQEGLENFFVNIANPSGATIGGTASKMVFIDGTEPR